VDRRVVRNVARAGFWLCAALATAFAVEALYVGSIASSEVVARYHFGSEAVLGHGGWGYASRGHYLARGLLFAAPFAVAAALIGRYVRRAGAAA
jgi:hypothetical protein